MKQSILISITIILIFIFVFINSSTTLTPVKLSDGNIVMVRERFDKNHSAILLNNLIINMYNLREILINNKNNYPEYKEYIEMLEKNFNKRRTKIYENKLNSDHTSYSVNKGEEFVFCLRCKKTKQLHDLNLLLYVAVHEMAHAGCPEIGHTPLYNKIFKFYLKIAKEHQIYTYENYARTPVNYCGLRLYTNILD
jgi:hypothetical protein